MAKQIAGLCRFAGTIDDLTFYKMDGQYYVRAKSSLTAEQVKKKACFRRTMQSANRMVRASHIGAIIYKALPPRWRQFWMYRDFTGEAFVLLKNTSYTESEITQILWKCYVDYWEQRKAAHPDESIWLDKEVKVRKRRKYSEETLQRRRATVDLQLRKKESQERRRMEREKKQSGMAENAAAGTGAGGVTKVDATLPVKAVEVFVTLMKKTIQVEIGETLVLRSSMTREIEELPKWQILRPRSRSAVTSNWHINATGRLYYSKMPEIPSFGSTGISNFVFQECQAAVASDCCDSS